MLTAPCLGSTLMVDIEHLNYGKLVNRVDGRVPSTEGYGVTRRSKGLSPNGDSAVRLPALLDVRRFDDDLIDPKAQRRGILLVRTLPAGPDAPSRAVLVRARLRPEDGEDGRGRLYQQAAIWFIRWEDWQRYPAGILLAAAELEADPDYVDDDNRFNDRPRQFRFPPWAGDIHQELSPALRKILNVLLPSDIMHEAGDDRSITFGEDEFVTEAEFLATVADALQLMPANYGRWEDISVASGLCHERKGLFIRYLPSVRGQSGPDIPEQLIRRRLERRTPRAMPRRVADSVTAGTFLGDAATFGSRPVMQLEPRAATTTPWPAPVPSASAAAQVNASDRRRPAAGRLDDFRNALGQYRNRADDRSATYLLMTIDRLGNLEPATYEASSAGRALDHEQEILRRVRSVFTADIVELPLGALFDLTSLFWWVRRDAMYHKFFGPLVSAVQWKLARARVLLPAEIRLVGAAPFASMLIEDAATKLALDTSNSFAHWLDGADGRAIASAAPLPELQALSRRLAAMFGDAGWSGDPLTGIHQTYVVTLEAVLGPRDCESSARKLLLGTLPRLVEQLARSPLR